jgi:hypothetical protein
MEMPEDL